MHRAEELKYKLHALNTLAAKAREEGSPVVRALKFRVLCEAAVALVLAHDRAVIPALRTLAWKDVRSDALVAYATFKQCVAALLLLQADDPQTAARIDELCAAADALELLGEQSIWPVADQAVTELDPMLELQLEQALETRDRTFLPADERPAQQLLDDAALILSTFPTRERGSPGRGR